MNKISLKVRFYRPAESKISAGGRSYVELYGTHSRKKKDGSFENLFVKVMCFKPNICEKAIHLEKGNIKVVTGSFWASLYEPSDGSKPKLSVDVIAEDITDAEPYQAPQGEVHIDFSQKPAREYTVPANNWDLGDVDGIPF